MKAYQTAISTEPADLKESNEDEPNPKYIPGHPDAVVENINFKIDWIHSTETQRMVKSLIFDSNRLVDEAIVLAQINHQQDNAKLIIHKLLEAQALRKVVEKYATVIK